VGGGLAFAEDAAGDFGGGEIARAIATGETTKGGECYENESAMALGSTKY
jgi:hypothetical protein